MERQTAKKEVPVQSVGRALRILECFYEHQALRITEISQMMKLNKSTAFGLVRTLEQFGFLSQDPDNGKYCLGVSLFRLGNRVEDPLRAIARDSLTRLANDFGETVNLSVRIGDCNVYLEKVESPYSMRICTALGQTFPLYLTAMGKSMLTCMSDEEVDEILSRVKFEKFTEKSLMDVTSVKRELEITKERGYALDCEEREYGLTCLAVPVFDPPRGLLAALSISGPTSRMEETRILQMKDALILEAARIVQANRKKS